MTDPKPSTNDIMAKIRAKAAAAAPAESAPEPPAVTQSDGASVPQIPAAISEAASSAPKSTADIMAAARAAAKPAAAPTGTAAILAAAKKAPGSAPAAGAGAAAKSPADIMAAIRAKAGAAPSVPATPAESDASSKHAAATPAKLDPAKAAGLSAADMIKAARGASDGTSVAAPKIALPAKPLPGKLPAAKAAAGKPEPTVERRSVLAAGLSVVCSWVVLAWTSMIAASTVGVLGVARFMMPNVLVEPPTKFKIGPPNDYAPGTVSTKWQAQFNIWVVNGEVDGVRSIYALSTVCTHLGCTPNWLEGEQKFKCPCHGSGFYKTGVNFEGPAPRPLERFGIRLAEDGMLEVDKSVKFQKELGQWTNPACFVGVT
jgi:cytochrome b6-f complex iron-sulfur subunit